MAAFTEYDLTVGGVAHPPSRIHEQMHDWVMRALAYSGADVAVGMKLHRVFVDAGFAAPQMIVDAMLGGSPQFIEEWTAFGADSIRSLLPLLVKGGIATEEGGSRPSRRAIARRACGRAACSARS